MFVLCLAPFVCPSDSLIPFFILSAFKQQVNAVRNLVNELAVENNRLVQENNELERQVNM